MHSFGGYRDLPFLADLYDYTSRAGADTGFYLETARSAESVLELGCGTGRLLLPLAEVVNDAVGLDISAHMLDRCRQKLSVSPCEIQSRVSLVQKDMASFDLGRTFDLVLIPFRSFQLLISVEAQMGCLNCTARHLAEGGRLVIDVFQVDAGLMRDLASGEEQEDMPLTLLPDGRQVRRTSRFASTHPSVQVNDVELIFYVTHPDGRTERLVQAFPFRYFFRYEMEHLLARAGFAIEHLYGDFDRSPLADGSPEMIFVATTTKLS